MTDQPTTYADMWADAINETYTGAWEQYGCWEGDPDQQHVLTKAADCLRGGATHTFTGEELDIVRHLMPAHEVHQSVARRWVLELFP